MLQTCQISVWTNKLRTEFELECIDGLPVASIHLFSFNGNGDWLDFAHFLLSHKKEARAFCNSDLGLFLDKLNENFQKLILVLTFFSEEVLRIKANNCVQAFWLI